MKKAESHRVVAVYQTAKLSAYQGNPLIEALPPLNSFLNDSSALKGSLRCTIEDIHLNKDKRTMVEVMVNYCKATHYKLIVEGIETKEELECLIQLGVEYGQGYYLKKPVDNFDDLLPDIKETIKKLYNKYKKTLDIPTIDSLCHFPCTLKTYQNILKNQKYVQLFQVDKIL